MKIIKFIKPLLLVLLIFLSCEKNEPNPTLEEFCSIAPDGWQCEIKGDNFDNADIPQNAPEPIAVIKYTNPQKNFTTHLETTDISSLTLDFYPIEQKAMLIGFIKSQQMYSWCIPIYYGETEKYFIVSSPCFINGGSFTEEANSSIEDLHDALKNIITVKDYND